VITLEGMSCNRPPEFLSLDFSVAPEELPLVVVADNDERMALLDLLVGWRKESGGRFLHDGAAMGPEQRQGAVVVLPRGDSLEPFLTVGEHVRLSASIRELPLDDPELKRLLAFAHIDSPRTRVSKLSPEAALRLTLALCTLGRPPLLVAKDPPAEVVGLLSELRSPDYPLLLLAGKGSPAERIATRVHVLEKGRLSEGLVREEPSVVLPRRYKLKVDPGAVTPQTVLSHHPGVTLQRLPNGDYLLEVAPDVSGAQLIRALVQGGVSVNELAEEKPGDRD
jgi:hypothetical protein